MSMREGMVVLFSLVVGFVMEILSLLGLSVEPGVFLSLFFFFFSSRRRHTRYWRDWSQTCALPIYFERNGIKADIQLSYGATEAKAPEIVDVVVDGTETGSALRAAGLRIIDTVLTSYTELIANRAARSEERRVGKECRSRSEAEHNK